MKTRIKLTMHIVTYMHAHSIDQL